MDDNTLFHVLDEEDANLGHMPFVWQPTDADLNEVMVDVNEFENPDMDQVMEWDAEGVMYATDGCVVEPDGTCPHGCKSWLIVMGLI